MTAPDPGLTDLIAAHREAWDSTGRWKGCSCGDDELAYEDWPAHVALVVEQHTNGRRAELEVERDALYNIVHRVSLAIEGARERRAALEGERQ